MSTSSLLNDVLQEVRKHHDFHYSASNEEQQQLCKTMLGKIKRVLLSLSSACLENEETLLVLELLRTVLAGQFCPHAHAVFGYGDKELVGRSLASLVHLICDPTCSEKSQGDLLKSFTSLSTFLSQCDPEEFVNVAQDLTKLIQDLFSSTREPTLSCFSSSIGKHSTGLILDVSSPSKRNISIIGSAYLLEAFCKVSVGRSIKACEIGFEVLCHALCNSKEDDTVVDALVKVIGNLSLLPDGKLRSGYTLMQYASMSQLSTWSSLKSATYAQAAHTALIKNSEQSEFDMLATHCRSNCIGFIRELSTCNNPELSPVRVVCLEFLSKIGMSNYQIFTECDFLLFSLSSSFWKDQNCIVPLSSIISVLFRVEDSLLDYFFHFMRYRYMDHVETRREPRTFLKKNELFFTWIDFVIGSLNDLTGLCMAINALSPYLDSSRSEEREWFLQAVSSNISSLSNSILILNLVEACLIFSEDILKPYTIFPQVLFKILSADEITDHLIKVSTLVSVKFNHIPLHNLCLQKFKSQNLTFDATTTRFFQVPCKIEHAQYLEELYNFIISETKLSLELEQLKIKTSQRMKEIIFQFTETSKLASFLPRLEEIIVSRSVSLEIRLTFIECFAEIIRKMHDKTVTLDEKSLKSFLGLLNNIDSSIRNQTSNEIACFIYGCGGPDGGGILALKAIFKKVFETDNVEAMMIHLNQLLADRDRFARRTLLIAVGSIGCASKLNFKDSKGESVGLGLLQWSLHSLSEQWTLTSNILEKSTVNEQFRRIAMEQDFVWTISRIPASNNKKSSVLSPGKAVRKLFEHVREDLYPRLFSTLLQKDRMLDQFLFEIFGDVSSDRAEKTLIEVFPVILHVYLMDFDTPTLERIAKIVYPKYSGNLVGNLLLEHSKTWIVHMIDSMASVEGKNDPRSRQVREKIQKIPGLLNSKLLDLVRYKRKDVLAEYVLRLVIPGTNTPNQRTEMGLLVLGRDKSPPTPVPTLIRNEFMYMMNILSERIQDRYEDTGKKQHALRCTARLLQLLGDYQADEFVPKIMPTLSSALQEADLQVTACSTLKIFALKLNKDTAAKVLSGFVVALLPCLLNNEESAGSERSAQEIAVKLINWLITEYHQFDKGVLFEIQELLPNHPVLDSVSKALDKVVGVRTLGERLERLKTLVDRDSDEIRLLALKELRDTFREHGEEINALILNGSSIASKLLHSLLRAIRSVSARLDETRSKKVEELSLKCCECLGELGAIDPALLDLKLVAHDENRSRYNEGDVGNKKLVSILLSDFLVGSLKSAPDPATHMKVGFVIQEILRFLNKLGDDTVLQGEVASAVQIFSRTNYEKEEEIPEKRDTRFFGPGIPFASSVGEWVAHLASVSEKQQKEIFTHLGVLKGSDCATRMMLFVLPYVVQNVLCSSNQEEKQSIYDEITNVLGDVSSSREDNDVGGRVQLSVQAVFVLLDTLERWVYLHQRLKKKYKQNVEVYEGEFADKTGLKTFLDSIPKIKIAEAAHRCGSFSRALLYFESHVRSTGDMDFELLHKIYASMGHQDPDGLRGVAVLRTKQYSGEIRLIEKIHELENEARWDEALSCYEEALENVRNNVEPTDEECALHEGQLRCLWRAGHLELLVSAAEGKVAQNNRLRSVVLPYALDSLWRLGRWTELKTLLNIEHIDKGNKRNFAGDYTESLAQALLTLVERREPKELSNFVEQARLSLLSLVSAASMESYERCYPLLIRLQGLTELERGFKQSDEKWWTDRLKLLSPSLRGELLAVRRVIYRLSSEGANIGVRLEAESWLSLAKTAREFGDGAACESALLMLRRTITNVHDGEGIALSGTWRAKIQRAELFKARGSIYDALQTLEPTLELLNFKPCPKILANARAKALLLHTNLVVETGSVQGSDIVECYKKVLQWRPSWEKAHYHLAKYYDYLMQRIQEAEQVSKGLNSRNVASTNKKKSVSLLPNVLKAYGETLKLGSKHLFEVLPRILTLWYSNSDKEEENDEDNKNEESSKKKLKVTPTPTKSRTSTSTGEEDANSILRDLKKTLPAKIWYAAIAQLVSRLGHSDQIVWNITCDILVQILSVYPAKALWQVIGVTRSKSEFRRQRARELLDKFSAVGVAADEKRFGSKTAVKFITVAEQLFDALISLAEYKGQVNTAQIFRNVKQFEEKEGYGLVVPVQFCLKEATSPETNKFQAVGTKVEVMSSKEKPKKIRVIGTESGKATHFLCKHENKGDLRKDSRLMEFNAVVNQLFARDVQGRRRRLRLRTYAVVCLNEECGLLEWVENTEGFRSQLAGIYTQEGDFDVTAARNLLADIQQIDDPLERVTAFREDLLAKFPPRFHKWFLQSFPDPSAWLSARLEFTRSAAVWSMVGHIVGLGDRHADNLLLDVTTGECVHVDFDCLFDKGLTLAKPEIVPFRLTRNIVDGMGLTGVEGTFRGACEISLGILRANKNMLLSVLESFVVDPLVEWSRSAKDMSSAEDAHTQEIRHMQRIGAEKKLDAIAERLNGVVRDRETVAKAFKGNHPQRPTRRSLSIAAAHAEKVNFAPIEEDVSFETLPLSTQGQVERLIKEATDEEKLSRMFVGWCPFL